MGVEDDRAQGTSGSDFSEYNWIGTWYRHLPRGNPTRLHHLDDKVCVALDVLAILSDVRDAEKGREFVHDAPLVLLAPLVRSPCRRARLGESHCGEQDDHQPEHTSFHGSIPQLATCLAMSEWE
jgi:hypothetical protein